ncbi:hypothetical protein GCM10009784_28710 [Arthrobacter parietis]|uniref:Uncharacterized protein n=1 Tax=Arthrobacter parietis TaxID=271434 RepID=A0ABP5MRH0_9MICC
MYDGGAHRRCRPPEGRVFPYQFRPGRQIGRRSANNDKPPGFIQSAAGSFQKGESIDDQG